MHETLHRRTLLRTGSAATVVLLSGCSESIPGLGGKATTDPDAGTDSYGLHLENAMNSPQTVLVKVEKPFEDETLFEETVEVAGGESREWEQVITENEEWAVSAKLPEAHTKDRWKSDRVWITPGSDHAPDVENVRILVEEQSLIDEKAPSVSVMTEHR